MLDEDVNETKKKKKMCVKVNLISTLWNNVSIFF